MRMARLTRLVFTACPRASVILVEYTHCACSTPHRHHPGSYILQRKGTDPETRPDRSRPMPPSRSYTQGVRSLNPHSFVEIAAVFLPDDGPTDRWSPHFYRSRGHRVRSHRPSLRVIRPELSDRPPQQPSQQVRLWPATARSTSIHATICALTLRPSPAGMLASAAARISWANLHLSPNIYVSELQNW